MVLTQDVDTGPWRCLVLSHVRSGSSVTVPVGKDLVGNASAEVPKIACRNPGFPRVAISILRVRTLQFRDYVRRTRALKLRLRTQERLPDSLQAVHHMDLGSCILTELLRLA
jgi:hypothetical protein